MVMPNANSKLPMLIRTVADLRTLRCGAWRELCHCVTFDVHLSMLVHDK